MTLLVATVTPEAAWLTTDSGAFEPDPGGMPEAATSKGTAAAPQGRQEGRPGRLVHLAPKVLVLPQARLALAGAGHRLPLVVAAGEVALGGLGSSLDELAGELPGYLAGMVRQLLEGRRNLLLMLVGWSDHAQRTRGLAFASGEGFEPRELVGHSWTPQPDPDAPGHDRLRLLAETAAAGELVETFHAEFAQNVAWSTRTGRQPPGFGVAGPLTCARVDRHGAGQRQIGEGP